MVRLEKGDNFQILDQLIGEGIQVDSVITDPPYGLSFLGKKWDYDVPSVELWKKVLQVLKPGGTALIFAGSRTQHRMAINVEDAGFELKDTIMYVYGSGFPKGRNIGKAIDKQAGAKREKILVPTKKGNSSERKGAISCGASGMRDISVPVTPEAELWDGWGTQLRPAYEPILVAMKPLDGTYSNNALVHGVSGMDINKCRIGYTESNPPIPQLDQGKTEVNGTKTMFNGQSFNHSKTKAVIGGSLKGRFPANFIHDGSDEVVNLFPNTENSASRFFYCAKASRKERGEGNIHPTVKPLELMRYLCRLTKTPTGGIVLDPYMGSGTTGVACRWENRSFIGIEREKDYFKIAKNRVEEKVYQEDKLLQF